jgi:hypothetical protein
MQMYSQTWAAKHIRLARAHTDAVNVGRDIMRYFLASAQETTHDNPTSSASTKVERRVEMVDPVNVRSYAIR